MKKMIFLMAVLMTAICTFAQTSEDDGNDSENVAYVRGTVTDQDGTPVQGAKVTLDDYSGNLLEGTTDAEGRYEIHLQAEDKDYYPTVYQKTVRTADVLALNIDISEWTAPSYTIVVENEEERYIGTFEPTLTSIEEKYKEQSTANDAVYDLMGRRVATPTKGLYIVGGKKVLIR